MSNRLVAIATIFFSLQCFGVTHIPRSLDDMVQSSKLIVKVGFVSKAPVSMCSGKQCIEAFLFEMDVADRLKGDVDTGTFCTAYNLDKREHYLLFLEEFEGHLGSSDLECNWGATGEFFRFGVVDRVSVIDVGNPSSTVFPIGLAVYEPRDHVSLRNEAYFSVNWRQLRSFVKAQ